MNKAVDAPDYEKFLRLRGWVLVGDGLWSLTDPSSSRAGRSGSPAGDAASTLVALALEAGFTEMPKGTFVAEQYRASWRR